MKKMGEKTARGTQRGNGKTNVKGKISSAQQREEERHNAPENRVKKGNNKENANNNGAEKAEEVSCVQFEFSPALRPRKRRKLFNQSSPTLSDSFLCDEGKIINGPLSKIIWHSWFKILRACPSPKQHFRLLLYSKLFRLECLIHWGVKAK